MSFIVTSDFQAEWENLDRCNTAWNEILSICKKQKLGLICVLGDLKQAYNPIDIRVVQWWQYAIRKAKQKGYKVLILLGNHDRVGAYSSADNWLSVLKRAGAITFDKPGQYKWRNYVLTLLPYSNDSDARLNAKECKEALSYKPGITNVLLFHQEIKGVKFNNFGTTSSSSLTEEDLYCSKYDICISGHIHKPQKFGKKNNIYYVGSPFAIDWGEVNQAKRYLVIK